MGAEARTDFLKVRSQGETARQVYENACNEAAYENGNGGYTGTIAEARGFKTYSTAPLLKWEADQLGDLLIRQNKVEKWGPCVMIPVAEATDLRTVVVEVDVTGLDWEKANAKVIQVIRPLLRKDEQIEELRIEDGERKSKVVATSTEGSAVTRYAIQVSNQWIYFDTLAEAKAWAVKQLEGSRWNNEFKIIKRTVRESGEPLAVVRRVPVKTTTKVTAQVGKPGKATIGWMAAGVYSS